MPPLLLLPPGPEFLWPVTRSLSQEEEKNNLPTQEESKDFVEITSALFIALENSLGKNDLISKLSFDWEF